jgi:RNase P/RNase MRP subunit p30
MRDLVLKNSKDMEERAQLLGVELELLSEPKSFKAGAGLIVRAAKIKEVSLARKIAKNASFIVADSTDEKTIRYIMEQSWIQFFTNIETSTGRDHTHYRRSNFNQVLANLAKNTGKTYVVDFSNILKVTGRKRAILLGRIMQNIRICDKFKVPVAIATFAINKHELRNPEDLKAFLRALKTKKLADIEKMIK